MIVDGHFWVERDGVIIDPWFKEYAFLAKMWGCLPERHYLKCPNPVVGDVFRAYFERQHPYYRSIPTAFGFCVFNALNEIQRGGGELVFGSMGFPRQDGSGIHWEYGGEDWATVKDFVKRDN